MSALGLWSAVWAAGSTVALAKRPVPVKVPSIAEVVEGEGFVPTPSQSELYRPGAVLLPNARGGHDEVVGDCIQVEPSIAPMAQSSIASTLSAGVRTRVGATSAAAAAGVEKRLTFIDPEQRTIGLGDLTPSEECRQKLELAGRISDLSEAVVVHDVLVAIVQNTVCTRADASGGVIALGQAEASAFSECVQESNAQVPLGFKAVPLDRVLEASAIPSSTAATAPPPPPPPSGTCPWTQIDSSAAQGSMVVINGQTFDVKGREAVLRMSSTLRSCKEAEAALAFEEWRRRHRHVNAAWSVPLYGWLYLWPGYRKLEETRQLFLATLQ